jgi:hypothetical protein
MKYKFLSDEMFFCIWHKDTSLTSSPEFAGNEKEIIEKFQYFNQLDYMIGTMDDRISQYVIIDEECPFIEKIN